MKIKKFIALTLSCMLAVTAFTACSGSNEEEGSSEGEVTKLTVGTSGTFYPVIYTDEEGNLTGFEYAVMEEIGKRTGLEIEWQISNDMSAMFGSLDAGKIDTIANQVSVTPEREETYNFSEVYAYNEIRMVVRGDDTATSVDDLQGRKVCIENGSVLQDFFEEYNKDLPDDKKVQTVVTEGSIYEELELGRIDAFPMTVLSFDQVKEKGEYDVKMIGDAIITDSSAFPFAKDFDEATLQKINDAIKEMHEDGTMSKLSEEYYKRDVTKSE